MSLKVQRITGWVLSGLIAAFLIVGSALPKFYGYPGDEEHIEQLGWKLESMQTVGLVEVVVTLLYLIPRTNFLGAILLTGYLGGAIATHARIPGDVNWIMPLVMGILVWVALALRKPDLWRLVVGANPTPPPAA